jgi:hypothetical protein
MRHVPRHVRVHRHRPSGVEANINLNCPAKTNHLIGASAGSCGMMRQIFDKRLSRQFSTAYTSSRGAERKAPSSASADDLKFHCFFDLPSELRLQVLAYLCHSPNGYAVGPSPEISPDGEVDSADEDIPPVEAPMNLFLSSSQLYREASSVFYETNTFHITLSPKRKHCAALLEGPTGLLSPSSDALTTRRRIRSIGLWYVFCCGCLLRSFPQ